MSLTTIDRIRHHLSRINSGAAEVHDQAVRLASDGYVALPHAHIVSGSEAVKATAGDIPVSERLTLEMVPAPTTYREIIPGTVVCARDSSLSRVYQENVDFVVDYAAGTIGRLDAGGIDSGDAIIIWYQYYQIYQRDVDYTIDYEQGRMRRIAAGGIALGQEVLVDYQLGITPLADEEIEQGITDAEAEIVHAIAPEYRESTDPALQTAATFLTLSLLCRNAAGLAASGGTSSQTQLSFWLELSKSYRETAERLLTWFRQSVPGLRPPRLA
ncbi:MAG: hypothetical protein PHR28_02630 [candidate division Zixibacteria bacterium]|nr:hypothetical protein [candidate division Zixibacteria bacterium]